MYNIIQGNSPSHHEPKEQFFNQCMVNVWNSWPHTVDFSSLTSFERSIFINIDYCDFQILLPGFYSSYYRIIHTGSCNCHVGLSDPQNTCFIFSHITTVFFILFRVSKKTDDDDEQEREKRHVKQTEAKLLVRTSSKFHHKNVRSSQTV